MKRREETVGEEGNQRTHAIIIFITRPSVHRRHTTFLCLHVRRGRDACRCHHQTDEAGNRDADPLRGGRKAAREIDYFRIMRTERAMGTFYLRFADFWRPPVTKECELFIYALPAPVHKFVSPSLRHTREIMNGRMHASSAFVNGDTSSIISNNILSSNRDCEMESIRSPHRA